MIRDNHPWGLGAEKVRKRDIRCAWREFVKIEIFRLTLWWCRVGDLWGGGGGGGYQFIYVYPTNVLWKFAPNQLVNSDTHLYIYEKFCFQTCILYNNWITKCLSCDLILCVRIRNIFTLTKRAWKNFKWSFEKKNYRWPTALRFEKKISTIQ